MTNASALDCLRIACAMCYHNESEVFGGYRGKSLVQCRELIAWLARTGTNASYWDIAAAMGRKNHTTCLTAYQRSIVRFEKCPIFRKLCLEALIRLSNERRITERGKAIIEKEVSLSVVA